MGCHLQEGLTVETATHEMDIVEAEKITRAAKVIYMTVVMNVVVGEECIHLVIRNTLSVGADRNEGVRL